MRSRLLKLAVFLVVSLMILPPLTLNAAQPSQERSSDLGRQVLAPNDGWGSAEGGTTGGSNATPENVQVVTTRKALVNALGGNNATNNLNATPKIIYIQGAINLSVDDNNQPLGEADYTVAPYSFEAYVQAYDPNGPWGKKLPAGPLEDARKASQKKQETVVRLLVGPNTTIVGLGKDARLIKGGLYVKSADNVIIRNIDFQDAYDYFPQWDPTDGAQGNWNSAYDNISVENTTHVWIDHCSFSDGARTDDQSPVVFANTPFVQHHDGLLDITTSSSSTKPSDFVTVSYNHFFNHDKTNLLGSSDSRTIEEGHLRMTFHHNFWENVTQRMPRVRFGQVHVYNNYYLNEFVEGGNNATGYDYLYSFGVGINSKIYAENNYLQLNPQTHPDQTIMVFKGTTFFDRGSIFNGNEVNLLNEYNATHPATPLSPNVGWTPSLFLKIDPTSSVPAAVIAQAGAGKLAEAITNFNLFVLKDLSLTTGGGEISGRLGVGGNAEIVSYNLASQSATPGDNVVVGGNLKLKWGQVRGNAIYNGMLSLTGTNFTGGSPIQKANPLEIGATQAYAEQVAAAWADLPANGTTEVKPWGQLILSGNDPHQNIFTLKGSDLAKTNSLVINTPAGASVIVNIDGSSELMQYMGMALNGGVTRQNVVFNFYQAANLTINGVSVEGTVWAPSAAVNFTNGAMRGTLLAQSMNGGSVRFENYPFLGNLPF